MSNFIKDYLTRMRASDEATRHRSALTISIIASVIILSIAFFLLKDTVFNFSYDNKNQIDATTSANNANNVVSPTTSFSRFFKDTAVQFSDIKNNIKESEKEIKIIINIIESLNRMVEFELNTELDIPKWDEKKLDIIKELEKHGYKVYRECSNLSSNEMIIEFLKNLSEINLSFIKY